MITMTWQGLVTGKEGNATFSGENDNDVTIVMSSFGDAFKLFQLLHSELTRAQRIGAEKALKAVEEVVHTI